jgi:hypothetical protein
MVVPLAKVTYDPKMHAAVRVHKSMTLSSLESARASTVYQDPPQGATAPSLLRRVKAESLGLDKYGGIPVSRVLSAQEESEEDARGHDAVWVRGKKGLDASIGMWVYPGPDEVACYPLEGTNRLEVNWDKGGVERGLEYAKVPRTMGEGEYSAEMIW